MRAGLCEEKENKLVEFMLHQSWVSLLILYIQQDIKIYKYICYIS